MRGDIGNKGKRRERGSEGEIIGKNGERVERNRRSEGDGERD